MPKQVNVRELDEFAEKLFRALDDLGGDLMPLFLSERPTAFEKYPRLLLGQIQRYGNVEAGFDVWATKALRDASNARRIDEYPELVALKRWLVEHRELFEKTRENANQLKRSMYARAYAYLYPRRLLTNTYAEQHRGDANALEANAIRANFRNESQSLIKQLEQVYGDGDRLEQIIRDAEAFLIANAKRLTWKLRQVTASEQTNSTNGGQQ